jgi:RNA polymerase sigma-70 factor (ECF subfamily)
MVITTRASTDRAPFLERSHGHHASEGADSLSGDSVAAAYRSYSRLVAHIGARILGQREEVDDLVQDVFLETARWRPRIAHPGAMKQWLKTVTIRAATRRLQKRRSSAAFGDDAALDDSSVCDAGSPEQRSQLRDIQRALARVGVTERLAWTLRYVEGESVSRVAELSGCSLATAKRRVARAHAAVLAALEDAA